MMGHPEHRGAIQFLQMEKAFFLKFEEPQHFVESDKYILRYTNKLSDQIRGHPGHTESINHAHFNSKVNKNVNRF